MEPRRGRAREQRADGPYEVEDGTPGNNTPWDEIDIRIEFMDEATDLAVKAYNVKPLFTARPRVTTETPPDGPQVLFVTASLWDPGVWDRHHVIVKWADGTTSTMTDQSTTIDPVTLEYRPTDQKTIRVERLMPAAGRSLYPITVTLHDDDQGNTRYLAVAGKNFNIRDGGNRIFANDLYSLSDLNYHPATGGITIFIQGINAFSRHAKKKGIDDGGKPDDRIKAILNLPDLAPLTDEVKYMVVDVGTFYPNLQNREELRAAMASEGVYGLADLPQFALRLVSEQELRELGMSWAITQLIGAPASAPGLKSAVYQDYVSRAYVLTFAGTDDYNDILVDLWQGIGGFTEQYQAAIDVGFDFARAIDIAVVDGVVTGHSLGGGLASAAAVVGDIRAVTFNSAGLMESTLLARDENGDRIEGVEQYPGSLERYQNATGLIDAYYLDWDILSFVQDYSPVVMLSALGTRYQMDGPVDAEMAGVGVWLLASKLVPGVGWVNIASGLGSSLYYMGVCHTTLYYHYGLMVDEETGWDIYGYELQWPTASSDTGARRDALANWVRYCTGCGNTGWMRCPKCDPLCVFFQ